MSKLEFELDGTNYIARGGFHQLTPWKKREASDLFRGADAIVMELRGSEALEVKGNIQRALEGVVNKELCRENTGLIDYISNERIPLYVVEPELEGGEKEYKDYMKTVKSELKRGFKKKPKHYFELLKMAFSKGEVSDNFSHECYKEFLESRAKSLSNHILGLGRNSIWARKIKEYIVPELIEKLGRSPKIGLDLGAAHLGIKYDLINSEKRNEFIESLKIHELPLQEDNFAYRGYRIGRVGQVWKAQRENDAWSVLEKNSGLF